MDCALTDTPLPNQPSPAPPPGPLDAFYYLHGAGGNAGPINGFAVKAMIESGAADAQTLVAKVGDTQWTALGAVPVFAAMLRPPAATGPQYAGPLDSVPQPAAIGAVRLYAGFWLRLAAYLLDAMILSVGSGVVGFVLGLVAVVATGRVLDPVVGGLVGFVLAVAYYVYFTQGKWQATPGKRLLGIYIVRTDGARISAGLGLGRYLCYIISGLPFLIGFMMIGWTGEKTGLHDLICDTRVAFGKL
jgi:uncharacterized RDD family membrane protein YckC